MNPANAPTILLAATLRWPLAARLAIVFAALGCRVDVVCPRQHPAGRTRAVQRIHRYSPLRARGSLQAAIEAAKPDLVLACDDDAALDLQRLYTGAGATDSAAPLRALIERSLGAPDACALATARGRLLAVAAEEGVRLPATTAVSTAAELDRVLRQHRFPVVLKLDRTWGGQGVAIVRTRDEAQRAFGLMASRPSLATALARLLLDRDPSVLLRALPGARRGVIVQEFIAGAPANRAVACWQGRVLAGVSVEAIRTLHATGPATVVQSIENRAMCDAVDRLVRRLGVSGLWGFDFVLQASTGTPYLVEANPRATPVCHLPLEGARSLPAALHAQLTGAALASAPARLEHGTVALFPGEWRRDSASVYLRGHFHDVPWDEPALVEDCIAMPWSERGWIARLWMQVRRRESVAPVATEDPVGKLERLPSSM